jgi:hypothetical protein
MKAKKIFAMMTAVALLALLWVASGFETDRLRTPAEAAPPGWGNNVLTLRAGSKRVGAFPPEGDVEIQSLMGTAFTYQGLLIDGGNPANGEYDFEFKLYDASSGGTQIGSTVTLGDVTVTEGLFTVKLDFGSGAFNGDARWLDIGVRPGASTGAYTTLDPRQGLTPSPYALALPGLWTQQNPTSPNIIGGYSGNSVTSGVKGATIGGGGESGHTNRVTDDYGTVGGGAENQAGDADADTTNAPYATVGGGYANFATVSYATVGGGAVNFATADFATVGGGFINDATAYASTIGGGVFNVVTGTYGTIAGGGPSDPDNPGDTNNRVYDSYGTIGGGGENRAGSDDTDTTNAIYATVGGGRKNTATADYATVGGGRANDATADYATIGGGFANDAVASYATIPGGFDNDVHGKYSFAAGHRARVNHDYAFVWSGGGTSYTYSWAHNTFTVRCHGGARFYSASGTSTGVQLSSGANSWGHISDRKTKENFEEVDSIMLLEALAEMPIQTWNLKSQSPEMRHIGPVAQDFNGIFGYLFGEVESPSHINSMDAIGVSLAAAQGLYQLSKEQAARIEELEEENISLREQLDHLEARVAALEKGAETGAWRFLEASILGGWSLPVTLLTGIFLAFIAQRKRRAD